jgi:hypothetical protein
MSSVNLHPTRQDTWLISVHIEDVNSGNILDYGTWDKMTGGVKQASATTYRPGGMQPPISLGGVPVVTNVVVSRNARMVRDLQNVQQLLDGVGKAAMSVTRTPLDFDGHPLPGVPGTVYNGTLDRVTLPDIDSEGTAAALLEFEMVVDGYPSHT